MTNQPKKSAPDEGGFAHPYGYLEYALRALKMIADEAEDERVRLRAVAHLAKISAGLLR